MNWEPLGWIKKKVKDFNQIFLKALTKFTINATLAQSLAIEYYTTIVVPSIGMFVKRANTNTLALNFDEDKTMERELYYYVHHPHSKEIKSTGKKPLLLTKQLEKEAKYIENVVKLVKKLSNEVVDLKKNVSEGSSKPITFHPFLKR
jgi:hypothetical protein